MGVTIEFQAYREGIGLCRYTEVQSELKKQEGKEKEKEKRTEVGGKKVSVSHVPTLRK